MLELTARERVWAEVDLAAVQYNYRLAQNLAGNATALAVVKANAYGHGAVRVAQALAAIGAYGFAVATADEALELRMAGLSHPLLVLGSLPPGRAREMASEGIAASVSSFAEALNYAAEVKGEKPLAVHAKVDTGMARLGMAARECLPQIRQIAALPGLRLEGLFTHFAASGEAEHDAFTGAQCAAFLALVHTLKTEGYTLVCHMANSGAVLRQPDTYADMVRPGIMLYGCRPEPACTHPSLRPAMALRARIAGVKTLAPGESVSYGLTWRAPRESRIAVVSAGYADGLPRIASGKLSLLVRGHEAPQVGRICMDMCMLDVTDIPGVSAGDIATVFGGDGALSIPVSQVAGAAGTTAYELLCGISARVPRYYPRGEMDRL